MNMCVQVTSIKLLLSYRTSSSFLFLIIPFLYLLLFIAIYLRYALEILQLRTTKLHPIRNSLFILADYNCAHHFNYNQNLQDSLCAWTLRGKFKINPWRSTSQNFAFSTVVLLMAAMGYCA